MSTLAGDASLDDLRATLAELNGQIRAVRDERIHLDANTPSRAPLIAAAQRARQDRDAQISPELTEMREKLADGIAELRSRWASADRQRWISGRIDQTMLGGMDRSRTPKRAAVDEVLAQEKETRDRHRLVFAPLGISVPEVTGSPAKAGE